MLTVEKRIAKIAFKEKQELFLFYDSPWSDSTEFPWDFPEEMTQQVMTVSIWENPELFDLLKKIGADIYSSPALIHFKRGKVFATMNGCGHINTHLNNYLRENNHGRAKSAKRNNSKRVRDSRKGSKGTEKSNRNSNSKSRKPRKDN